MKTYSASPPYAMQAAFAGKCRLFIYALCDGHDLLLWNARISPHKWLLCLAFRESDHHLIGVVSIVVIVRIAVVVHLEEIVGVISRTLLPQALQIITVIRIMADQKIAFHHCS